MVTAEEYIMTELQKLKVPVQLQDIGSTPLEEAIFKHVMSKKFRKLKASPFVIDFVKDSIQIAVKEDAPLSIGFVHGGSKPWSFGEYPEVDWAELFTTMYMVQWMRYIAEVYDKGVHLEFYSMDVCQERMNGLPRSETDRYSDTFMDVIQLVERYLPERVTISYRKYSEDYADIADYDTELDAAIARTETKLAGKLPQLTDDQKYKTEMNARPTEDQKNDPLWREKVEVIHMSVEDTEVFKAYLDDRRFIPACPTPVDGTLVVGSTKKSLAKFWFGAGGLEERPDGTYNEIILTPKQLHTGHFTKEKVNITGLNGKNFSSIRVRKKGEIS